MTSSFVSVCRRIFSRTVNTSSFSSPINVDQTSSPMNDSQKTGVSSILSVIPASNNSVFPACGSQTTVNASDHYIQNTIIVTDEQTPNLISDAMNTAPIRDNQSTFPPSGIESTISNTNSQATSSTCGIQININYTLCL